MATTTAHEGENERAVRPSLDTSEGAILSRVLDPACATLTVAAAQAFLKFGFPQADMRRMRALSAKAQEGSLSSDEQHEINNYERVGHIVSLMKSKARRVLKDRRNRDGQGTGH